MDFLIYENTPLLSSREIALAISSLHNDMQNFYKSRYNSDYFSIPVSWPKKIANSYGIPIENIAWHFQTFVSRRLSNGEPRNASSNTPTNTYPETLVLKFVLEILLLYPICPLNSQRDLDLDFSLVASKSAIHIWYKNM